MKKHILSVVLFVVAVTILSGCAVFEKGPVVPPPSPAELAELQEFGETLDYQRDIQTIFDRRCVGCHSCYNSPCQLKMTSYEGVCRGATKTRVYNGTRLEAVAPTRLFIDETTTEGWRKRDFVDVTGHEKGLGPDSFMYQLLDLKQGNPEVKGEYDSEAKDLVCSQSDRELKKFMRKNPHAGMPFGFPEISKDERRTLKAWLAAGAKGPSPEADRILKIPANGEMGEAVINRWEDFLNDDSPKTVVTARYIYEHLFLAHIGFEEIPGDFFRLVRSRTPAPQPVDEIDTEKPYDDPGGTFFYRFLKEHSTIVFKTHIIYRLSDARMARYRELFLEPDWPGETIIDPGYDPDGSANPFWTFRQIPPRSRYRFLLDDSRYFIMTFIRGPVCKGQIALNVINDHFWVMFLDPEVDLAVNDSEYLERNIANLRMPIEDRGRSILGAYLPYAEAQKRYVINRAIAYQEAYPEGQVLGNIWDGDRAESDPFLTIYRHFDSATVIAGPVGGYPRSGWVIDFPLFERLYYNLVAGFNVFGNVKEQAGIRMYMDLQRREGEMLFLDFLPAEARDPVLRLWYPTMLSYWFASDEVEMLENGIETGVYYPEIRGNPVDYKDDFFDQVISNRLHPDIGYGYDGINFHDDDLDRTPAEKISSEKDLDLEFRKLSHRSGGFAKGIPAKGDVVFIRFTREGQEDLVYTMILNRYHEDVEFIKGENWRLNKDKDTVHFRKGFLGAYPNTFLQVELTEAPQFFRMLDSIAEKPDSYYRFFQKFGVNRSDLKFWEISDFFNERFKKDEPETAGIFDLNRYTNEVKPPGFWGRLLFHLRD
ncbi:MAG: fatty acid cis/trans isomerase [Proteobacteria bacterium]|nr:fatty acid cis/trans isomerase [Pseudomonadota bacterium]MBU1736916.1 fatty acid cis/trans isomerase [Pseudomonadota bacterium]